MFSMDLEDVTGIAQSIGVAIETFKTEIYSVIASVLSHLKVAFSYVQSFLQRLWVMWYDDPVKMLTFSAMLWCMLS
ncbi:MAG: hypothetical protein OCU22_07780 [Canidatus Methanoxibalbensis ujae]|nr:hypothetical protein [Candidatus Methanoxibalbensis ujae]